jgi:hypothetical protein
LILFPYDEIAYSHKKLIKFGESFIIILCVIFFYKYYENKIVEIKRFSYLQKIKNDKIFLYIQILNAASLILFIYYYIIKIISILVKNKLYLLFLNISVNVINESLKYLFFYVFIAIIYILIKHFELGLKSDFSEEIEVIIKN